MRVLFRILFVLVFGILLGCALVVGWFYSGIGLPNLDSLVAYQSQENSKIFAADGTLLCELHGDEDRESIPLEKMPDHFKQAVIAVEDSSFYKHSGVDWAAILRALWMNLTEGGVVQGGSTITQQYVKRAYTGGERTVRRKIEEAYLAYQLENRYSKHKILELYLNEAYFGEGCYGIYVAAERFYGKEPMALTLAESAMLAGLVRSPSYFNAYDKPEEVLKRRSVVLGRMASMKYITQAEAAAANAEPMVLKPREESEMALIAPYFCDYVTKLVVEKYGDEQAFHGGLRIYTTLDLRMQGLAEEAVLNNLNPRSGPDAAVVAVDPRSGYLKAMVGGKNYTASQFNVAAEGQRQAGSSFKTFVLVRALADGVSPEKTYNASSPITIPLGDGNKWTVRNYAGSGSGSMTITAATIRSINVVFAQLIMDVGPARVAELAKQMGIRSEVDSNPAIALGGLTYGVTPLDMASAYGTLANGGVHAATYAITKITDVYGNTIDEASTETATVLDTNTASKANQILSQVVSSGTGTGANIGRPQAGKTGTAEDYADAWFVGYTPDLSTAVWVGYPQGRVSMGAGMTGGSKPASIWASFMRRALEETPKTAFSTPKR